MNTIDKKDTCAYCNKPALYSDLGLNDKGMFAVLDVCKCHLKTYAQRIKQIVTILQNTLRLQPALRKVAGWFAPKHINLK